jgi:hypothetical protein
MFRKDIINLILSIELKMNIMYDNGLEMQA